MTDDQTGIADQMMLLHQKFSAEISAADHAHRMRMSELAEAHQEAVRTLATRLNQATRALASSDLDEQAAKLEDAVAKAELRLAIFRLRVFLLERIAPMESLLTNLATGEFFSTSRQKIQEEHPLDGDTIKQLGITKLLEVQPEATMQSIRRLLSTDPALSVVKLIPHNADLPLLIICI